MIRIVMKDIEKYYGANYVLKKLNLEIFEGERVGILGPNGAGKSTAFKIISGSENYETGDLFITRGAKIGVLDQIPVYPEHYSVKQCLYTPLEPLMSQKRELDEMTERLKSDSSDRLLEKYGELLSRFELADGYSMDDRVNEVAKAFNFDEIFLEKPFMLLSGGEKTKVNLACLFLSDINVLLLDEPTNHLDLSTINWVEDHIKKFAGTVVVISHDRYFLNQAVTRIIEINDGQAQSFKGNYDAYSQQKKLQMEQQMEQYTIEQKKIRQLEEAAKRMHEWAKQADSAKMHRRAFSIEKRIERIDPMDKPKVERKLTSGFDAIKSKSNEMARLEGVKKAFGENVVLKNFDGLVRKNDRIALLGNNGSGKTTLLKMLLEMETLDSGTIKLSPSAEIGYLPQEIEFDDGEMTVLEWIKQTLEKDEASARGLLAQYRFKQDTVFKKLSGLSGGEKTRLMLCKLMNGPVNFLFLDEPTNHLDIESREWVEEAVSEYTGTMVFVSHDRHFIMKFSSKYWTLVDGEVFEYEGDFEAYKAIVEEYYKKPERIEPERIDVNFKAEAQAQSQGKPKLNTVMIEKLENEIEEIEERLLEIEDCLYSGALAAQEIEQLIAEKEALNIAHEELYDRWTKYSIVI
ncbi:MAG: ATP-binding cassette domain-containing protein [Clostridiales bacterium]|nr:ATP-binding cassette domain-containing protein [Clostridiales bacterium]